MHSAKTDILSSLLFAAVGAVFAGYALTYEMGSARHMGSGYFPLIASILLLIIAAVTLVRGLLNLKRRTIFDEVEPAETRYAPAFYIIIAATCVLAYTIESLGTVISLIGFVFAVSFSAPGWSWKNALLSSVAITLPIILLFWGVLGMPLQLWPAR